MAIISIGNVHVNDGDQIRLIANAYDDQPGMPVVWSEAGNIWTDQLPDPNPSTGVFTVFGLPNNRGSGGPGQFFCLLAPGDANHMAKFWSVEYDNGYYGIYACKDAPFGPSCWFSATTTQKGRPYISLFALEHKQQVGTAGLGIHQGLRANRDGLQTDCWFWISKI